MPELPSVEDRVGWQYATQKNNFTANHASRSAHIQQQTQHLRRLQSKSKIRPMTSHETKSSTSSSIAHRIELLKQAMHNHQLEIHSLKSSPNQATSPPRSLESMHKQTQTADTSSLKSAEVHHIHHHHIYSSSLFSLPWRTYLSILVTMTMIFFLLIQFITIHV